MNAVHTYTYYIAPEIPDLAGFNRSTVLRTICILAYVLNIEIVEPTFSVF